MSDWLSFDWFSFDPEDISALLGVIWVNLALSGDNAIVIALAVAGLPVDMRRKGIIFGIGAATVLRVAFALITTQLLAVIGLTLLGGLLLLWVAWKMWVEVRARARQAADTAEGEVPVPAAAKSITRAITQIIVADVSMSFDNVLAVASLARDRPSIMAFGLVMSIALMAFASTYLANMLDRHAWLAYVGLAIIAYVGADMIWAGSLEVYAVTHP
ncbi:MAG: TerC family protein [Rhodospirillales bacterium]|nr:TerC family protein [Rhodospirillales bacterium]